MTDREKIDSALMRAMKAGAVLYVGRTADGAPVRVTVLSGLPGVGQNRMTASEFIAAVNQALPKKRRRGR